MNCQSVFPVQNLHPHGAQNSNPARPQMAPQREGRACRKAREPGPTSLRAHSNSGTSGARRTNSTKARRLSRESPLPDTGNPGRLRPKHCGDAQFCGPVGGRRGERLGRQVWEAGKPESLHYSADSEPCARNHNHNRTCEFGSRTLQSCPYPPRSAATSATEHEKYAFLVCTERAHSTPARPVDQEIGAMALGKRPGTLPRRAPGPRAGR